MSSAVEPSVEAMRLLIVEEDRNLQDRVIGHLEAQGIRVTVAATAADARRHLDHNAFDVAILDLTPGDRSGVDLIRALNGSSSATHVIMLSEAGDERSRMRAFQLGADDYILKPFFVRELTARVLAVRRRHDVAKHNHLHYGRVAIDLAARQVTLDDEPVDLTTKEFDLLACFAGRPRHAFSRDELLRSVWRSAGDWQHSATVTEHVRRLRSKLDPDRTRPRLLHTVRGVGYRFDPPPD